MRCSAMLVGVAIGGAFACGRVGFDAERFDDAPGAPPAGTCAEPIDLEIWGEPFAPGLLRYTGTTTGGSDHGESSCACPTPSNDVVLRYTPAADGRLEVFGQAPTHDILLHARTICGSPASEIACNDDTDIFADPNDPRGIPGAWFETDVTASVPVYIFADGCRSGGPYALHVRLSAAPHTGTCTTPIDLATEGTVQPDGSILLVGDTAVAYSHGEGSCACESPAPDVVVRYVPATSGMLEIRADGDSHDTLVYVRTTCDSSASELQCDDDGGAANGVDSLLRFAATAGQPLFIFVDGCRVWHRGTFRLIVVPP